MPLAVETMSNDRFIRNFGDQLSRFISSSAAREDMQKSLNVLVQGAFAKLDLVTREQFDSQLESLKQAEAQLASLEEELAILQARLDALEASSEH